ncbi:MAG: dephospho-CoA kinase [Acidobacteriota bacterium]|nr:dephospho-CoA kinase [Acidobacteriota bacterium]
MPPPSPYFGLTGGIACGKTVAAAEFASLGARIIDADRIGHELLAAPGPVQDEIVREFGRSLVSANGGFSRKALGAIVFASPGERRKLEAILHPPIIERQEALAGQYRREDPKAVVIIEAALIYEAGVQGRFSKILVAWCTPAQQIERLMDKAGLEWAEAQLRIASQMTGEEKRRRADFVIDCSGSLEQTRAQARLLYPQLQRLALASP